MTTMADLGGGTSGRGGHLGVGLEGRVFMRFGLFASVCLSGSERAGSGCIFKVNAVLQKYFRAVNLSYEKYHKNVDVSHSCSSGVWHVL